jgi:hypothetical protein
MSKFCVVCIVLVAAVAGGCNTFSERYVDSEPLKYPYKQVWEVSNAVMSQQFEIEKSDEALGKIESRWSIIPSPMRFEATRTKVYVEVKDKSKRERNESAGNPSDIEKAEWEDDGFDEGAERSMLGLIELKLMPMIRDRIKEEIEKQDKNKK